MSEFETKSYTIPTADGGAMPTDITYPAGGGAANGVIIVPAIFGLDDGTREIIDAWAARGTIVMVPDLFWRTIPGPLGREDEEREKAQARYADFDAEQGMKDLADALAALKADGRSSGKVAVFGYCFGGRYAYLAAARLDIGAAVSFHGTKIGLNLDEAAKVACPLSIHVGDADRSVPMEEVEATRAALAGNSLAEVHVYPGCAHGFTGKGRPAYDAEADAASTRAAEVLVAAM
jgi:carboxymethylenebutenolidase